MANYYIPSPNSSLNSAITAPSVLLDEIYSNSYFCCRLEIYVRKFLNNTTCRTPMGRLTNPLIAQISWNFLVKHPIVTNQHKTFLNVFKIVNKKRLRINWALGFLTKLNFCGLRLEPISNLGGVVIEHGNFGELLKKLLCTFICAKLNLPNPAVRGSCPLRQISDQRF
jgi:hypothetical protein